MALLRVEHKKNYAVINNFICTDKRLSFKAKGIWMYAFSRPDDWEFYLNDLINQSTDGKDSVASGIKELEDCGYLIRKRIRDAKGQMLSMEWTFVEKPELKEKVPQPDNPVLDNPVLDKPPLLSIESLPSIDVNQSSSSLPSSSDSVDDDDDEFNKSSKPDFVYTKSNGDKKTIEENDIWRSFLKEPFPTEIVKEAISIVRARALHEAINDPIKYIRKTAESLAIKLANNINSKKQSIKDLNKKLPDSVYVNMDRSTYKVGLS